MDPVVEAAITPWGIVALAFAATAVLAAVALKGQLRVFSALVLAVVAALLGAVALTLTTPSPEVGGEALAGLQTDIPEGDRELAERLLARALNEVNSGNSTAAHATYDRARSLFRDLGDILGEGQVALGLGQLEHFTGQSDRARANYSEALSMFRRGGSARWQAVVLAAMGDLEKDTFNWAEASTYYREAREQWARAPDPKDSNHVLLQMADAPRMPADTAREILEQADKIYANLGDAEGIGDVKILAGDLAQNLGEAGKARGLYANARIDFGEAGAKTKEARSTLRVASVDLDNGYNRLVALGLDIAEPMFEEAGDVTGIAGVTLMRGDLARLLGLMEEAEAYYAAASIAFADLADRGAAEALLKLGQLQARRGAATAAETLNRAAVAARRVGADDLRAAALLADGVLARENGSLSSAESKLTDSANRFRRSGEPVEQGRALLELARVYGLMEQIESALDRVDTAEALFVEADLLIGRTLARLERGSLARSAENPGAAAVAFGAALDAYGGLDSPLAAANAYLDLPATDTLRVKTAIEVTDLYDELAYGGPQELTPETLEAMAANLAAHPNRLVEGRAFIVEVERRLAEADAFIRARE